MALLELLFSEHSITLEALDGAACDHIGGRSEGGSGVSNPPTQGLQVHTPQARPLDELYGLRVGFVLLGDGLLERCVGLFFPLVLILEDGLPELLFSDRQRLRDSCLLALQLAKALYEPLVLVVLGERVVLSPENRLGQFTDFGVA